MASLFLVVGALLLTSTAPAMQGDLRPSIDYFRRQLNHSDWHVRIEAAEALGRLGPQAIEAAPALVNSVRDWRVRRAASQALVQIGRAAVPEVLRAFRLKDASAHVPAQRILAKTGPAIVPDLITAARNPDAHIRNAAIDALGELGPAAAEAIPVLVEALKQRNLRVMLPQSGKVPRGRGSQLLNVSINDDAEGSREKAAAALSCIGPKAVPALVEAARGEFTRSTDRTSPTGR